MVSCGREEEGVECAEGLRCGGEVEEGLRWGGLDGEERSGGGGVASSGASEGGLLTHGCDVGASGGAQGEVGVMLCSEHVNVLLLASCESSRSTFVLRLRLQVPFLGLLELRVSIRVREVLLALPCLVGEIPNIDHLHLLELIVVEASEIPRRVVLLAGLREDAVHECFLGFAADLRFPCETAGPVAETVHAHADGADAVWFSAIDHFPGHTRHEVLYVDKLVVVVSHYGFAEEVVAFRCQGQGYLVVSDRLMLVVQYKPTFSGI